MNGTAQRERHTAINDLRVEVRGTIDALIILVGQQLTQEREAWTKEIAAEHAHIEKAEAAWREALNLERQLQANTHGLVLQARADILAGACVCDERWRRNFWGRLRWLVTGR